MGVTPHTPDQGLNPWTLHGVSYSDSLSLLYAQNFAFHAVDCHFMLHDNQEC